MLDLPSLPLMPLIIVTTSIRASYLLPVTTDLNNLFLSFPLIKQKCRPHYPRNSTFPQVVNLPTSQISLIRRHHLHNSSIRRTNILSSLTCYNVTHEKIGVSMVSYIQVEPL